MKITEKIVNLETNEESLIERDATEQEIAEIETGLIQASEAAAKAEAKEAARLAVLEKLGLTADEVAALLN